MVISYADYKMRLEDPRFPVGQARLEAIGVLACESPLAPTWDILYQDWDEQIQSRLSPV